jgi:hypothetical protein
VHFAEAAGLPDIKANAKNPVPECVTPGRLMSYLRSRNPELNPRFESIATEYMRTGEMLGVRWDYAFYQMIIETGSLSYRRGDNRAGDVKPTQNNFAGLGATGRGEPGETFKDVPTGVRAHLEHLLLYSGEKLDSPTADRTRKVQEWGVLTKWHARFSRPITFADMAQQWAPGSNSYSKMLDAIAERFTEFCAKPDPHPEMVREARGGKKDPVETKTAELTPAPDRPNGADLAKRAMEENRDNDRRSALGAIEKTPPVPFKVLNSPPAVAEPSPPAITQPSPAQPPAAQPPTRSAEPAPKAKESAAKANQPAATAAVAAPKAPTTEKQPSFRTASAAGAAKPLVQATPPTAGQKCRVWTASYGGQKALIIRSVVDKVVNYTVLDVNEGAETREAEAFIAAYAKDGKVTGEFTSQSQALDKAFELCPEG